MAKLILVGGGTASGKTYVINKVIESLGNEHITHISIDDYYKDLNAINIYEKINEKCKYDDSKRLLLGLNINKETHNKIIIKDKNYYNEIKRLI